MDTVRADTVRHIEATGGGAPPETVKVWDAFVRVFHWSLVSLFFVALLTPDLSETLHQSAGYGIAALLTARVIWGMIGSQHARFSDFVRSPREILQFLKETALLRAKRYLGHNPAGGAMVIALIVTIAATCITGHLMTLDRFWGVKWLEKVHDVTAWSCVGLIVLHVLGVVVASLEHRENLVVAMFTGRKRK